ncbi:MAG: mucoidy inhibitor MuiA family protein [Bacteroidota bacterium]
METFLYNNQPRAILRVCLMTIFCLILNGKLHASEQEQRIQSNITNVTVFLNQAQVTRVAKVNVQAGVTQIIFDRVSPFINLNSIQVKTESNLTLLSVSQRNNYLLTDDKPKFILDLEDTLQSVQQQIAILNIRVEALLTEKEVLLSNKNIGGENSGVKVEDLEDALTLFRKRTQEIGEELLRLKETIGKLTGIKNKLQAQLDGYLNNQNSTVEIVVTVKAITPINQTKIEWTYLVGNASWRPFYDIRVKDTKSPLQLVSKAYITQSTGEDWKNVVLKLSTANPNESGTKPELNTSQLYFRQGYFDRQDKLEEVRIMRKRPLVSSKAESDLNAEPSAPELSYHINQAVVNQATANIEFTVTSAYTIPSDNNPNQVDLTVNNLNATYSYGAVPKLDKDAFVTAKVSGNDLINQISGEANVYFDGIYTGKTFINGTVSDSLTLSLGRDKRIQIQRVQLKDFSSKSLTGSTKRELNTWEITLRNTRKEPITIEVEDQIPVSTDKEIEVKLLNNGNAIVDENTGKLKWFITLEAEKSQTLRFSFEVKYPKDKFINAY